MQLNLKKILPIMLLFVFFAAIAAVSVYADADAAAAAQLEKPHIIPLPEPVYTPDPTPVPPPTAAPYVPTVIGYQEVCIANVSTKYHTYQTDRTTNMRLAARAIDYKILENGEVFSFNGTVGPRTSARGYKEAIIFVGDKQQMGLGGGICQVSSSIHMAAKRAGMAIVERYPHSQPVSYCTRDDEATVSWGYLDFKFRNNTGDPVRIEASVADGVVNIKLWQRVPVYAES